MKGGTFHSDTGGTFERDRRRKWIKQEEIIRYNYGKEIFCICYVSVDRSLTQVSDGFLTLLFE